MVNLSRGSLAALILLGTSALSSIPTIRAQDDGGDGGGNAYDASLERDLVDDDPIILEPVDSTDESTQNLIVTYSTPDGLQNIEDLVNAKKGQGKRIGLKSTVTFRKPQRRNPISLNGGGGGGNGNGNGNGGGNGGDNGGGNDELNGKGGGKGGGGHGSIFNRFLEVGDDSEEEELDIGFAVIETSDGITSMSEEEIELSELDGVTNVEHDVELTVMEVTSLRGANAANEHVREIVEAMKLEAANLDVEYTPEHYDTDDHGRHLAEETPYGITMVNVTHLWSKTPQQHVKICVVDTGYDLGHPDLPNSGTTGWDTGLSSKGTWNVDGHSHGTHCAGTIGAIGGNDAGVVGVNNDPGHFSFHIGKGLSDSGSGSGDDVINAVKDCVAKGAKVISMSLGCSNCYVSAYNKAYNDAYDAGVLIVAAAGNSSSDTQHYPSGYKSVVSVASVREGNGIGSLNYGELSYFSTRNDQTELAGPGHYVKSTVPRAKGSYGTKSGTSMACPHVAGVAAILMSLFPACTNNQIRNAMIHSTREPPLSDAKNTPGWDKYYGWGIVNAGNAYELLESQGCVGAGGKFPSAGETLSSQALGGKDQKIYGCTDDSQCDSGNACLGTQRCNLSTNTCYTVEGTMPDCSDSDLCTIDTCDPTRPSGDMCVHTPRDCDDDNKCNGEYTCNAADGQCVQSVPPVDCDDGNACTIDTCITSTGTCTYADRTCNDNNACTFGDTCDVNTGCVFAPPSTGCCGNAQCEASYGENESTCPADCSTTIVTSVDTTVARYRYLGSKFNLVAKDKNITITGTGVHCILPPEKVGKVHVYAVNGDYYGGGNWYKKNRWTKVVETDVTCAGHGAITDVQFPQGWTIPKGQKSAFSIYVLTNDIFSDYPTTRHIWHPTSQGGGRYAVYKEDSFVQIQTGSGNFCSNGWCAIITPMAYSGSFSYAAIDDSPTESPTITSMPSMPPPTASPVTPKPTTNPTVSPSKSPTKSPTVSPTSLPSFSTAPSEFVPEVVELKKEPSGWANILRSAYFKVTGGSEWSKIIDMRFITYRTTGLKVFMKRGPVDGKENAPCQWTQIAETKSGWYGHYWKRMYPEWDNGFEPVILEPNEVVSFYVSHHGSGYGFLGKRTGSRYNYYANSWGALDGSSPVGAVKMGDGRCGVRNQPFKPCNQWYSGYGMYGGLKMETMRPGATQAPSFAPTTPYSTETLTSAIAESDPDHKHSFGLQFDMENLMTHPVTVTSFNVHLASTGTQYVEVWYRRGSHECPPGGCDAACASGGVNYNNRCGEWTKLVGGDVTSLGPNQLTPTPTFALEALSGAITSFAIVTPDSPGLRSHSTTEAAAPVEDGRVRIKHAHAIHDYFGDAVQTSRTMDQSPFKFEGSVTFDVVNSKCAILSKAPWAVLDYGSTALEPEDEDPEEALVVYQPEGFDAEPTASPSYGFTQEIIG